MYLKSRYEKYIPTQKQRESIREFFNCDNSVKLREECVVATTLI